MSKIRKKRIEDTLFKAIDCQHLNVIDESGQHHVPQGAETHFKVEIVSAEFDSVSLLQRHRKINELLSREFSLGLHALSIHAFTEEQWQTKQQLSSPSPSCLDGFKHND